MGALAFLVFYIIPSTMVLSAILILPLPRLVKRVAHFFVDLKFERLTSFRLGSLYVLLMAGLAVSALLPYLRAEVTEHEKHLEPTQQREYLSHQARNFRNFLIYALGFFIAGMNFVLSARQKKIWRRQDEVEKLESGRAD